MPPITSPFPSPLISIGPGRVQPPRIVENDVLALARQGPVGRDLFDGVDAEGLLNERRYLCYTNCVLTLLANLDPFAGYLNRVHGSHNGTNTGDLLTLLNNFTLTYWALDDYEPHAADIRRYLINLPYGHRFGLQPHMLARPTDQDDAAEWLDKILELCSAQLRYGGPLWGAGHNSQAALNFDALVKPVFQKYQACAGTGRTCADKKTRLDQARGDLQGTSLVSLAVEPDSTTLSACIAQAMKYENELRCDLCSDTRFDEFHAQRGRAWNTVVDAPEILFFKLNRWRPVATPRGGMCFVKTATPIAIPQDLDLAEYMEEQAERSGKGASYRLQGVISHVGTMDSGHYISYVRNWRPEYRDQWVRFNDAEVEDVTFEDVLDDPVTYAGYPICPYVLAYTKVHDAEGLSSNQGTSSEGPEPASEAGMLLRDGKRKLSSSDEEGEEKKKKKKKKIKE